MAVRVNHQYQHQTNTWDQHADFGLIWYFRLQCSPFSEYFKVQPLEESHMQPTWFHLSTSLNHSRSSKHLHVLNISSASQCRCLTERCKHPVGGGLRATQLALFLPQEEAQLSASVITSAADLKSASCFFQMAVLGLQRLVQDQCWKV